MPHFPKPFHRPSRDLWYVQVRGKQVNLGRDREAAFKRYHELMAAPPPVESATVAGLVDGFLDWCLAHRAASTYAGYRWHLQRFVTSLPDPAGFPAADLKPHHAQRWADAHPTWGQTYRRNALAAVQRAFAWAEKLGHIDRSPVRVLDKPAAKRRAVVLTAAQYTTLLAAVPDRPFRDLLELLWESGMRPQEARLAEARHFDSANARLVFPPEEAKGKKRWRVVPLTPKAVEIVARNAQAHPTGPLMRNTDGNPWKRYAVNCRFQRLRAKLGMDVCPYQLRHRYCQRLLEAGLDSVTVGGLMGHADASMVSKVYSSMDRAGDYLAAKLAEAMGTAPRPGTKSNG